MRVNVEIIKENREEVATLEVYRVTHELEKVINRLRINNETLSGQQNGSLYKILVNDIYYIESVEHKTFVYTKNQVYEIREKLYQLEEKYQRFNLVRISKSVIVNIDKIESIAAALNARFEIKLVNEEKLMVSRSYVKELKSRLQM